MKSLRMRLSLFALLAVLLAGGCAWYLRTDSFRELVRANLKSRLEEATGLQCRMDQFDMDLLRGTFRIGGFHLLPPSGSTNSLRVDIDQIRGSFRLVSVLSPKISLREMNLARPRLKLEFGKGSHMFDPEQLSRAIRSSLELAAQQLTIEDGEVELNNKRIPLDLSFSDLVCEIRYRVEPPAYQIRLAYRNGRATWARRALAYDLDTVLNLTIRGLDIDTFEVRRQKTVLRGEGWLRDWEAPVLLLHARGKMPVEELSIFHPALKDLKGDVNLAGNFRWDALGFLSMGSYSVASAGFREVVAENLRGLFELREDAIYLKETEGRIGAGKFQAEAVFHPGEDKENKPHRLQISAQGLALHAIAKVLNLPGFAFENLVDGAAQVLWRRGLDDLNVKGSAKLHGMPAASTIDGKKQQTALEGDAEFQYKDDVWYIPRAVLYSPNTEIEASAHEGSRFHVTMKTSRLAEPLSIVQNFSGGLRTLLQKYPDFADVPGSYELDGDISAMSSTSVVFEGQLRIVAGRWRVYRIDSLAAEAFFDSQRLELRSLKARKGSETAEGFLALTLPAEEGGYPDFSFRGSVLQVDFRSLRELGFELQGEPAGSLSATGALSHKQGVWSAEGDFRIGNGAVYGERFDSLGGRIRLSDQELRLASCELVRGAAKATLEGKILLNSRTLDLKASVEGYSLKDFVPLQEKQLEVDALASASGEIRGTLDNPAFKGSFDLLRLRYGSWNLGQGKGTLDLKDRILEATATIQSDLGAFKVQARVSAEGSYSGKAHFDFKDWNARRVITEGIPPYLKELSTAIEGTLDAEGPFADPSKLTIRGEMDGARFKINDYELRNSGKIRFSIAGQKARVDEFKLVGEGSQLSLSGTIPFDDSPNLGMRVDGVLNLKALQPSNSKLIASGTTNLNVRATGSLRNPQIIGQANLNNCRFDYEDLPFPVTAVQGGLTFSSYTVRVEGVRGRMASGSFQVTGYLEHQNAEIRNLNLQVSSRGTRLPYPKDFRTTLDADLVLRGSPDTQVLTGDVRVIQSEYIRDFNLLEQLTSRTTSAPGPLVTDPILAGLRLDITIRSEDGLRIDNDLLRLQGRINLTLRGTPAYPSLTGRVEANEGSIFFRGNRFEIVRAAADFVDRNRINPQFEVRAEADVKSYRLILDVNGDLDNLRSNIRSDPPLATVDIVSLLATGKAREQGQTSRRQAEITGVSAASILSESLTGVIGKRVGRLFGLESFRVDPFLAGVESDPTARVTITERLSKDFAITFSRNLSTDEEQIIVLEYDVSRNLSIIATRNEDGKFGVDFRFRKRFK